MGSHTGRQVAVKAPRLYASTDFDKLTRVGCSYYLNMRVCRLNMTHVEVLQGNHDVGEPLSPERVTAIGGDDGWSPFRNGIGVDGEWKYRRVRGTWPRIGLSLWDFDFPTGVTHH